MPISNTILLNMHLNFINAKNEKEHVDLNGLFCILKCWSKQIKTTDCYNLSKHGLSLK